VRLDKVGLGTQKRLDAASLVLALASKTISLGTLQELGLGSGNILWLATPCTEDGCLESTTVAEGKRPWLLGLELVDGIEVDGRLLLGLTSRQEGDASDGSGDSAVQGGDGGQRDLLSGVLLGARLTSGHHVGLQEGALEEHVVVVEGLVNGGQNGLCDLLCSVQVVVTIGKNLRLDNGNDAVSLAD